MSRILIIEDEEAIADLEKDYLELSGFEVEICNRGDTGLTRALNEEFDLIILDLMLPEVDGFDICRQVRQEKNTPIIMVSAKKDDIDKIRGLGLGADDYMTKPFSPSELVARVKAHMDRYNRLIGSNVRKNDIVEIRGIKIDKTARRVWVNGEEKTFTSKEYDLLTFLAENPNRVFTKEELFREIWDMESVGDIATVTVHIKKIRLQAMKKIAIKVELASGILVQGASLILQAGLGITIFIGTVLITGGKIELLPLLVLLMFSTQIYGPILAILSQLTSLFHLETVTNRMRTLLTTPAMEGEDKDVSKYDIELKNVTFGYNQDDVIKDVSFSIPAGSVMALVGPSGSGKSTISKLIARFWDIRKGQITIGGMDVSTIEPEHLMRCMSFVFQDVTLFNDTVFNNIRVGNMNATEEQVMAAAKAAYCNEFIQRLPDGYQTILGENGSTLSGGERQRISIARALLKDAPIILLDEATASLDPENEVLIQRAIAKLVEGKTVIMIAHRLRTVVDADQILVLDNGRLVEHGTHDELMKKNGLYHKLFHIQQESLGWAV